MSIFAAAAAAAAAVDLFCCRRRWRHCLLSPVSAAAVVVSRVVAASYENGRFCAPAHHSGAPGAGAPVARDPSKRRRGARRACACALAAPAAPAGGQEGCGDRRADNQRVYSRCDTRMSGRNNVLRSGQKEIRDSSSGGKYAAHVVDDGVRSLAFGAGGNKWN